MDVLNAATARRFGLFINGHSNIELLRVEIVNCLGVFIYLASYTSPKFSDR